MEHAMSVYHPDFPHGAGLIMISKAFYEFFIEKHACDDRFIRMSQALGMKDAVGPEEFITMLVKLQEICGVSDLKMSDYGFTPNEFDMLAKKCAGNDGRVTRRPSFEMSHEDCVQIFKKSYR